MITHQQAYSDRQYLWQTHGQAYDMTGGYVESEDLEKMLKSPTKRTATKCLCNQIHYWFEAGAEEYHRHTEYIDWSDPKVREIAERHNVSMP